MLNVDREAVAEVRKYLDEVMFNFVSHRLIPGHLDVVFPKFEHLHLHLQQVTAGIYHFLLTLFRQGHAADDEIVRDVFPARLLDAFVATGLLVRNTRGQWRTPGLAIVPVEGLYLVVSLPAHYPTALNRNQPVYLGIESLWLGRAIPGTVRGRSVLDLCSGSGFQGLVCAARGASRVVCLEALEDAVTVARFNSALNGLDDVVEVRQSELFSALEPEDIFDLVLCDPPYLPVPDQVEFPYFGDGGPDGMRLLRQIVPELPRRLSPNGEAILICAALGDQYSINLNQEILRDLSAQAGVFIRSYVFEKMPVQVYCDGSLDQSLQFIAPSLSAARRAELCDLWLESLRRQDIPASFVYGEIVHFWKGRESGLANLPTYRTEATDPLAMHTAHAQAV